MANQSSHHTLFACSALAIAIVTLYYWQFKKRRKISSSEENLLNISKVEQLKDSENFVDNSLNEENSLSLKQTNIKKIDELTLVNATRITSCSIDDSDSALCTESNQSAISFYNCKDKLENESVSETFVQFLGSVKSPSFQEKTHIVNQQIETFSVTSDCSDSPLEDISIVSDGTQLNNLANNQFSPDNMLLEKSSNPVSPISQNGSEENLVLSKDKSQKEFKITSIDSEVEHNDELNIEQSEIQNCKKNGATATNGNMFSNSETDEEHCELSSSPMTEKSVSVSSEPSSNDDQVSPNPYQNSFEDQICYQFEIPHYFCGRLIGASGHFINSVKQKSNTQIVVNAHYYNREFKICSITGLKSNVMNALHLIRKRFPLKDYPTISLNQINVSVPTIPLSQACQLHLPPDIKTDVILSCTINAGHFFLQQPTHPSYTQLNQLDYCMKENYSQDTAPHMPSVYPGIVCAAHTAEGWFRALVKNVHDSNTECDIMFVDYGGYAYNVSVNNLRQIRYDFLTLPFQASECFLANVAPIDAEKGWSAEANSFFEDIARNQIIYASIIGYSENEIPCVNLYKIEGTNQSFINSLMVEKGYAVWINPVAQETS